jgi:zinc D-Ala-D-Ala carboxypeptidase
MLSYVQKIASIVTCILFGNTAVSVAKTLTPESNDRAVQQSVQKFGYMQIPGIGLVNISDPIYVGSHFTWGEATKNGSRIPRDIIFRGGLVTGKEIAENIVTFARDLDKIRSQFGNNPITINSWYRPPDINAQVDGAAKDSIHQVGLAADFVVANRSSNRVYNFLDLIHPGGLGRYDGRTHVDRRDLLGDSSARW